MDDTAPRYPVPATAPAAPKRKRKRGTLPDFTPVPRLKERSNGWNPEIQRDFIEALADTGSVRSAARAVGRSEVGAYQLRRHPEGDSFARAWEAALKLGIQKIEDVAMDRALNGVEVPVYHFGQIVGTRKVYNDYLLMFLLRNRSPKRFAADNAKAMSAVDKAYIARLTRDLRKQWEREQFQQEGKAITARNQALADFYSEHHRKWFLSLGPRARAAYRAYRIADCEERASGHAWMSEPGAKQEMADAEAEYDANYGSGGCLDRRNRLQRLAETFLPVWEARAPMTEGERQAASEPPPGPKPRPEPEAEPQAEVSEDPAAPAQERPGPRIRQL